jgi:drug/metabolite transporter (DMT)-like permease
MYGFFYAIAHIPLSSAMLFTYSSPIFIPLVAWLFLKERPSLKMFIAAALGLMGVILVCQPETTNKPWIAFIGLSSSFLAAMAFVTIRSMSRTEPTSRIVFYFSVISSLISAIPMLWAWRPLNLHETLLVGGVGVLATFSQFAMSRAYSLAPAGKIGPAAYQAIIYSGIIAWFMWGETPNQQAVIGTVIIFLATLLCVERSKNKASVPIG